jgi:hypothetical protein
MDMLHIEMPESVDPENQDLYKQLAELSLTDRMKHVETIVLQSLRGKR